MAKIIRRSQIAKLLDFLEKNYLVIAPIQKGDEFVFELINPHLGKPSQARKVALDYPTTVLPPTKVALLPPKQLMFNYNKSKSSNLKSQISELPPQVLFGVHDYDIQAINILDQVMSAPNQDYYYLSRRKKTIIIGIEHQRTPQHFDHYFPFDLAGGYDLFLSQMKNFFIVSVGSNLGQWLVELPFFEDSSWKIKRTKNREKDIIFSPKTSKLIEKNKDSKIWDKVAETCLGCGVCSYVCPLCYCFETSDEISLDGQQKCRYRRWDACFLPDFFQTAAGNTKTKLRDRIYNWYHHKFVRMPAEYGHPGCVGCGRCIAQCPAKINFREVLEELIIESAKTKRKNGQKKK